MGFSSATLKLSWQHLFDFYRRQSNTLFFSHKIIIVTHQKATNQQILKWTCTDAQSSSPHTRVQEVEVKIKDHSHWANSASQLFGLYRGTGEMCAMIHRSTGDTEFLQENIHLKIVQNRGLFWPFSGSRHNAHGQMLQLLKSFLFCKTKHTCIKYQISF